MKHQKSSKWAMASGVVSVIAALALIFSGYGYQWGWWQLGTAFGYILPASILFAVFGLVLAAFAFASKTDRRKGMAVVGITLSIAVFAVVGYWYFEAQQYPPIHDITTDVEDPPQFKEVLPFRGDASNDTEYAGEEVATVQKEHYPDIQTLYLEVEYSEAYQRALEAARQMPWEQIVSASEQEGRIEATDKLAWFGFKDDIVIRVDTAETNGQSKIDVRSISRIGQGDIGVNAHRIREYLETVRGE